MLKSPKRKILRDLFGSWQDIALRPYGKAARAIQITDKTKILRMK